MPEKPQTAQARDKAPEYSVWDRARRGTGTLARLLQHTDPENPEEAEEFVEWVYAQRRGIDIPWPDKKPKDG